MALHAIVTVDQGGCGRTGADAMAATAIPPHCATCSTGWLAAYITASPPDRPSMRRRHSRHR